MPMLPTRIQSMNRSRKASSDPLRHQRDNVYLFSQSRLFCKPRDHSHPVTVNHTVPAPRHYPPTPSTLPQLQHRP
nr:unnamed protein product [Spirometra erinaceieuropaei]